ncbi:MAG: hypothetical protein ACYDDA_12205 [Acidiferrobacteraceae bacterium]
MRCLLLFDVLAYHCKGRTATTLAAAMRLHCAALVTGDRTHFGTGYSKVFGGATIHSRRSLAQALFP